MKNENNCAVCGEKTKEDDIIIFCEDCGFNINKEEKQPKQNAVESPQNSQYIKY